MHSMVQYYLPAEGDYDSAFGGDDFTGPMRNVKAFTNTVAGPGAQTNTVDAAAQANNMVQQLSKQEDAIARARGMQAIRVKLPLNGKRFLFEKLLVLPGDSLWFAVRYSDWEVEK
jgi:hypothetical protein